MVLSNDKKRREFIEDPANWEQVGMLNNLIRLMKLTYKEHEWFAIDIWQSGTTFDFQKRKTVPSREWRRLNRYKITEDHALSYGMSVSQIADEIKAIDKEEKKK